MSRGFSRLGAYAGALALIASVISGASLSTLQTAQASPPAPAVPTAPSALSYTGADFDRGNIISDENFFNPNALGAAQVQAFIDSKVTCAPGAVCLANLRVDTFDIPATPMCSAYSGASQESAATIIYKVGRACGISQAVILVTLQKEQSLVTARAPSLHALSAAMGTGCYDDGQPCVDVYAGFFNQIFNGAYLLKRYTQPPGTGPGTEYTSRYDLAYPVGQISNILVSTLNCGTLPVYVSNQATHSLYVYTPYTPNAAALANLGGTGDVCSSYGNRNFWSFYYDWFGNPLVPLAPLGWLDSVSAVGTAVTAKGWAIDGHTSSAITVQLSVDGRVGASFPANITYPGLGGSFPVAGDNHGFSATTGVSPGTHEVCVTAVSGNGATRNIGCKIVTVAGTSQPTGWLDRVTLVGNQATASGWAIDLSTPSAISVKVSVDGGAAQSFPASGAYPGLGTAKPGFGDNHGFAASVTVPVGTHSVCVTATNDTANVSRDIGCRTVTVNSSTVPIGWLDRVTLVGTQATAYGWTIDQDTASPISVRVTVDGGSPQSFPASNAYPGLGNSFPGFGDAHGFAASVAVPVGTHSVCIVALDNVGGANREIGCRTLTVNASNPPTGWLDSVSTDYQQTTVSGWALDPDTAAAISVRVSVDGGAPQVFPASNIKAGLGTSFPGFGDNHGFSATIAVPVGNYSVCVTAIDNAGGTDRAIGCGSVTATSRPPVGWLDSVNARGRMVTTSGWALDPDTASPISVRVSVDGAAGQNYPASNVYAGLGNSFPGSGDSHGYAVTLELPVGTHTVCVVALNNEQGPDGQSTCKQVVVTGANVPLGWLDSFTTAGATVTAAGWAFDPDTVNPVIVQLALDGGAPLSFTAGNAYSGLGGAFPGFGDNHGFSAAVTVPSGTHSVCVTVINDVPGTDRGLGCTTVTIP